MATTTTTMQADLLTAACAVELTVPRPMLASSMKTRVEGEAFDLIYSNGQWIADVKMDGWRVTAIKSGTVVVAWKRSEGIIELDANIVAGLLAMPDGIYDGEYMATFVGAKSGDAATKGIPKRFVVFDVLALLGQSCMHEAVEYRRALLEQAVAHCPDDSVMIVPQIAVPTWSAFLAVKAAGGEGLILKRKGSKYQPNKRSGDWLKVKQVEQHTVTITGFVPGKLGPCEVITFAFADGTKGRCGRRDASWSAMFEANPAGFVGLRMVIECHERYANGKGSAREPRAKEIVFDHMAGEAE